MTTLEAAVTRPLPRTVPFARGPVLSVAAVVAAAQLAASLPGGYWFDEMYMLAIGRHHLDWGSADQPPVAPLLAALMDAIAPGSIVALRLPAVLATVAAVVVAALVARELGGDRRAQTLTAGVQATGLWTTLAGHWLTPYALEPVQWLVVGWLLVRWIRTRDDRLLMVLGLVIGVAAQTKFQVLLLAAVLLLAVLACGPRELLRRPMLWVGAGAGLLIALPTLVWQALHGWPQLKMTAVVAAEADALYAGRPGVAVTLIVMAGVAGTALLLYGLWVLVRSGEMRPYRFFAVTFVALYAVFALTPGRPYYLCGLYGIIAAAAALGLQRRREAGRRRFSWVAWPAYAVSAAAAGGLLLFTATTITAASDDIGEAIAQRASAAYHDLPPGVREHTALMGGSYIVAAYLDGYSLQYDLPQAHSGNRGYGWFPPPSEDEDTVLFVGSDPEPLRPYFSDVRMLADGGPDASVWLCSGRELPWDELWPRLRTLTVG
ncbi:glycosyltransferase family 39 protein [Pseudonocardia adelaidensis]|uniref:glycosyltransferase family 39 protein n=1 Tax=Pseudonocardia adelaidensis TaxID=648754 RepID=UPI0031E7326D